MPALSVKKGRGKLKAREITPHDLAEGQHVKDTEKGILGTIMFANGNGTYAVRYSTHHTEYKVPREHLEEVVPRMGSNPGVLF